MKKLITIPDELVEPLLLLAAKEYKGNLHACIVNSLFKVVENKQHVIIVSDFTHSFNLPINIDNSSL